MTAQGTTREAVTEANRAGNSRTLENLARIGFSAYGLVHLLVAWLAVQLAWGGGAQPADQSGAMATLARQPLGKPLLWVLVAGFLCLALWQAAKALNLRGGWSAEGKRRRQAIQKSAEAVAMAVVYLGFGYLALRFAVGSGQSSVQTQQKDTAGVLGWPGGRVIVVVAGLILIGVGARQFYYGVTRKFLDQIDLADAPPDAVRLVTAIGRVGFPSKGVALILAGGLFGYAAITFDPSKARGLDGAMETILSAPFGAVLLTLVAVGIAAFGAFCFARARYPER
jgi:hypothetical protein